MLVLILLWRSLSRWFLGESGDPLSAPFAMFLERFSVRGVDDDPEFFEGEDRLCLWKSIEHISLCVLQFLSA